MIKKAGYVLGALIMMVTPLMAQTIAPQQIMAPEEKTGEQIVAEIIVSLDLEGKSLFEKVILCVNWIDDNIRYDYEGLANGGGQTSLAGSIRSGVAICTGYANVFREFMDQIGVPCVIFHDDEMNHAYNMVLMNDYKWYLVEPQTSIYESDKEPSGYGLSENFLVGTEDFVDMTIYQGDASYSKFTVLANQTYLGYPVAQVALREDPNPEQKAFISKSKLSVTQPEIYVNAATCSTSVELPIQVESLDREDLRIFYKDNFTSSILTWEDKPELATVTGNYIAIEDTYDEGIRISYPMKIYTEGAIDALVTPVEFTLTVTYPKPSQELLDHLWWGDFKKGTSVKLEMQNANLSDFNIIFEPGQNVVVYNPTTHMLIAQNSGSTKIKLQSKTNPNYIVDVQVYVGR